MKLQPAIPNEQREQLIASPDEYAQLMRCFTEERYDDVAELLGDEIMAVLKKRYVAPVSSAWFFGLPVIVAREIDVERYFVAMTMLLFKLTDHIYPESPEMIERQVAWALAEYDQYTPETRVAFVAQWKRRLDYELRNREGYVPPAPRSHKPYANV